MAYVRKHISTVPIVFLIVYSLWWLQIQTLPDKESNVIIHYFAGSYGLIAVWGALIGLHLAKRWGGLKSLVGKALTMFALGLLFQEFGQLAYAFYIVVLKIDIPYPSIGDVGYFGSIFFYLYGSYLIAKTSGINFSLKKIFNKFQIILIPTVILGYTYFLFLKDYQFDWSAKLMVFLDFGYPLGQSLYIAVALSTFILTKDFLGGIMRSRVVFILFALLLQYLADFNFLFESSRGTWTTAGYGDYLYLLAYFAMTMAILSFRNAFNQIKQK